MRRRTVLLSLTGAALVLVAGVGWYLTPIAPVATGYAAKTLCSGHFVSGRAVEDVQGDLPSNPLVPFLRTSLDESEGTVSSTLLGLWGSTAWFTPGTGCTLATEDPGFALPPSVPSADEALEVPDPSPAVDAVLDTAFAEDLPGDAVKGTRAVVVLRDGQVVAERYAEGFDAGTPLLGWSMTKSVANAIVGRLVQQGALDVDARDLRPAWSDDARSQITLDHLLHMTDGLAFDETYDPNTDATNMLFRPRDTGAFAASQPLVAEPGTRWDYSSGTTNIICDIAVEASGIDGISLARELVFAPLGMDSAVLEPDVSGDPVCSSFMYATARDWARFGQWFLQGGTWNGDQLLPEDWVAWSTEPVDVKVEGDHPYGAQWWLNEGADGELRMPTAPADAFWASGNEGQQVVVLPSQDMVVVRLGLTTGADGISWGLEELVTGLVDAIG